VPRSDIHRQTRLRLLPDAVLRHERADRDRVVAVVLAQRRRRRCPRQHRSADGPHADEPVGRVAEPAAARVLRQGDRRLDVDVPRLRVRVAH